MTDKPTVQISPGPLNVPEQASDFVAEHPAPIPIVEEADEPHAVSRAASYSLEYSDRLQILNMLHALDDEGFHAIAWDIYQKSKTAGGYRDHAGWLRVREACEAYTWIAEQQQKFDAAEADEKPVTVVKLPEVTE